MNIEITPSIADEVTRQCLLETWHDMEKVTAIAMWSTDPEVEARKRRKFKKALRKVLNYYSAPQDQV